MIADPLQMNDWKIQKFLIVFLGAQVIMWIIVVLHFWDIYVPVVTQFIGFIYLAFLPGIIILRCFRLHKLGSIKSLLYSVGLSLAFNMFLGLIINLLYPLVGIARPISPLPIIITWTVVLAILLIIAYIVDRDYSESVQINAGILLSSPGLLLLLIPLISILGVSLLNMQHAYAIYIQLLLLALVAVAVLLIVFGKYIYHELIPLAVLSISLSLLFHFALVSFDLAGRDARLEYYLCSLVVTNGVWESTYAEAYNALISVTILPTIFAHMLNIGGKWVFIVIWNLFYALVPLGVYHVCRIQIGDKNAFLAAFYLLIVSVFYAEMTTLPRQEIGLFFLSLIIILLADNKEILLMQKKKVLLIIFTFALILSHYAVSYLFLIYCLVALILKPFLSKDGKGVISLDFLLLFIASAIGWYLYNAQSLLLEAVVNLGEHIFTSLRIAFLTLQSREVSFIMTTGIPGPLRYMHLGLLLLMQVFIGVGILRLIFNSWRKKAYDEYKIFSLVSFFFLLGCVIIPYLSDTMSVERLYIIALLFMAPFSITGGELVLKSIWKAINTSYKKVYFVLGNVYRILVNLLTSSSVHDNRRLVYLDRGHEKVWQGIMSFLLAGLFLLASGFIYILVGATYSSPALNTTYEYPGSYFNRAEVDAGLWLLERMDIDSEVWVDDGGRSLFWTYRGGGFGTVFTLEEESHKLKYPVPDGAYIYLRKYNINNRTIIGITSTDVSYKRYATKVNIDDLLVLDDRNKIYSNGNAVIYKDAKHSLQ